MTVRTAEMLPLTETITPAEQAEVAEAVRNAGSKGAAVYPIGGGTMLDYGVKPKRPGIGLSLAKLNRVVDYPAADLTITVEAGITISELNRCLAHERQRLPVDVPQPDRATIGGAVALNAAGPRRYGYGMMRDYLLGFTAVDGAGTTFTGGGRVVKNAAGYNMCRLMAGSLGTLGVITQVTLMVRPLCEASVLMACPTSSLDVVEKLLAALIHSSTRPVAVELMANSLREDNPVIGPDNTASLYVGFEGSIAEVDWMVEQLRREWAEVGVAAPLLMTDDSAQTVWRSLTDGGADVEIHVLPSEVIGVIGKLLETAPPCTIQGHAGDGVIGMRLPFPWGEDRDEESPRGEGRGERGEGQSLSDSHPLARLRAIAADRGGTMTVLKHPEGIELSTADIWGPPGPEIRVMQAIKERFDPQNILNPGRFVYD